MEKSYRRIGLIAALAMLSSLASASVAGAHHSTPASPTDPITGCGQEIITAGTTVTMTHDVGPCPGDGIVIKANNVVLDMNGRTITGGNLVGTTGDPVNCCTPGNAGVKFVTVTGSTVKNGTIRLFNSGVVIAGGSNLNTYGSGNTVDNITAEINLGSLLTDYGEAVTVSNSDGNTVTRSRLGTSADTRDPITVGVSGNGPYSGLTLLGDSDYNKVGVAGGGNTVEVNVEPSGTSNQDDGIRLEPDYAARTYPDNNVIEGNTVRGNALDGIVMLAAPKPAAPALDGCVETLNTIKSNTVRNNGYLSFPQHRRGDGIRIFPRSCKNTVEDNTVMGNAGSGIRIDGPVINATTGVLVVPGSLRNTIQNNGSVSGNAAFPGNFDLFDGNAKCGNPSLDENKWIANASGATRNQDHRATIATCIG